MAKMTKGPSLTAARGKISSKHCLTSPGYKTKPLEMANAFAQKTMSKGSFSKPSVEPKMGKSNFPGQGRADSMPMGAGLKRGESNFGK